MEFARAAVSLPEDGDGERWRRSIVPIISLHAVTMALGELELLPEVDRPFARDRAAVVVADANTALRAAWRSEPMPDSIVTLRNDAIDALETARYAGATELRWPGPGILEMPAVDAASIDPARAATDRRTLCVAAPGTPMMPGAPVAWWIGGEAISLPGCIAERVDVPRQVYRVLDRDGRATRDLLVPLTDELPAGMPLLVPLYEDGEPVGRFPTDAATWRSMQRAALPEGGVPLDRA